MTDVRLAWVDDHNLFTTQVFSPPLIRELQNNGMNDIIIYAPRYRSKSPNPTTTQLKFVWSSLDFPFTLIRAFRKDKRNVLFIPLEQVTMGRNPLSLAMVPFLLLLCHLIGMKTIINLQGIFPIEKKEFNKAVDQLLSDTKIPIAILHAYVLFVYGNIFKLTDQIQVFCTEFQRRVFEYGEYYSKTKIVDFGVSVLPLSQRAFRPGEEVPFGLTGKKYFLVFGFVVPRKGIDTVLAAWTVLYGKHVSHLIDYMVGKTVATQMIEEGRPNPEAMLVIAGDTSKDPKFVDSIQSACRTSKIDNSVVITGRVDDETTDKLFRNCIAVILPHSYNDSISGPLCTALSYNKPIIARDVGVFADLFDADTGVLFDSAWDLSIILHTVAPHLPSNDYLEEPNMISALNWKNVGEQYFYLIKMMAM